MHSKNISLTDKLSTKKTAAENCGFFMIIMYSKFKNIIGLTELKKFFSLFVGFLLLNC